MVFQDKYGINHYFSLDYRKGYKFVHYPNWGNGKPRTIESQGTGVKNPDPYDYGFDLHCPEGNIAIIDGKGSLFGKGGPWRCYWYDPKLIFQFYNTDITVYARIIKYVPDSGAHVILRIMTLTNHFLEMDCESSGTAMCTESKWNHWDQLKKEFFHIKSSKKVDIGGAKVTLPNGGYAPDYVIDKNAEVSIGKLIGYRQVAIHTPEGLLLIYYKDKTGGKNGGVWESVGMRLDTGNLGLTGAAREYFYKLNQCKEKKIKRLPSPDSVIQSGYGVGFRFDNMEMELTKASIFAIKPYV